MRMRCVASLVAALMIVLASLLIAAAAEQAKAPEAATAQPVAPAQTSPSVGTSPETPPAKPEVAANAPSSDRGADVVLLMDISGSMKKTDPRNYRKEAARLFISLLTAEDRIGLVSFGDDATTLSPLTDASKEERAGLVKTLGNITSNALTTNITAAVKSGMDMLAKSERKRRVLILMSDGKLDLGDAKKEEESLKELLALLDSAKASGLTLYCIAFSEYSDTKLLKEMADRTGGFFRYAASDKDIHLMFATMFEKIKAPDALELKGETFMVDKDVREAILLVTKQPGTTTALTDPSGKRIQRGASLKNIQWFSAPAFDMITIEEPKPGLWRVKLSAQEGNKVFILTDLKLKTSFDKNSVTQGETITLKAWLEKDGILITAKDIIGQVTIAADLKGPDGTPKSISLSPMPAPEEGFFAGETKPQVSGDYTLTIRAVGKTFNRTREFLFTVAEPPAPAQPVAPAQPPAVQVSGRSDIASPFGIASIALLIVSLILAAQAAKYRKLWLAAIAESTSAPDASGMSTPDEPPAILDEAVISAPVPAPEPAPAVETTDAAQAPDEQRIVRLLGVIEYQKTKMSELKSFREMLLETRTKLSALNDRNREIEHEIEELAPATGHKDTVQKYAADLGVNNDELAMFIELLGKEDDTLVRNFEIWEREVIRILKSEDLPQLQVAAGEPPTELLERIEALEARLKESDEQLKEKAAKVADMMTQYEDLEKEYMILYQKHQAAGGDQPNI